MALDNITTAFVQSYGNDVAMMAQQTESRLLPYVRKEMTKSERHFFELYDTHALPELAGTRNADLILGDTNFERRAVDLVDYEDTKAINKFDVQKMQIDPKAPVTMAQAAAFGRLMDRIIARAVFADMKTGKTGSVTSALPATQLVGVASHLFNTGASGNAYLTTSKVTEAGAIMDANEIPAENRIIVADGWNLRQLLSDVRASSTDFVDAHNMENGYISQWGGFKFIRLEDLEAKTAGGAACKRCFAFHPDSVAMAINENVTSDISQRKDKTGLPFQSYMSLSMAATRLQNKGVVEIECLARP